jgi:hypothetical protein
VSSINIVEDDTIPTLRLGENPLDHKRL